MIIAGFFVEEKNRFYYACYCASYSWKNEIVKDEIIVVKNS